MSVPECMRDPKGVGLPSPGKEGVPHAENCTTPWLAPSALEYTLNKTVTKWTETLISDSLAIMILIVMPSGEYGPQAWEKEVK